MKVLGGVVAVILVLVLVVPAFANNSGQCPDFQNNIPTNDGTLVLPSGTSFCVHASNANTGVRTADGVHDLNYYIGLYIVNNGGQTPAISNYVIYGAQPSPTPSSSPSAKPTETPGPTITPAPSPSVEPSATPTFTPPPSPSVSPTPTATPPTPTVSPSPTVAPTPSSMPLPTPPATDTE